MNSLFTEMMKPFKSVHTLQIEFDKLKMQYVLDNIENVFEHMESIRQTRNKDTLIPALKWFLRRRSNPANVQFNVTHSKKFGRLTPNHAQSYISISRPVRHFLAKDLYWDIDVDNCHHTLMEQIFPMALGRESRHLKYWNNNRDALFKQMMSENTELTRDDCKSVGFSFLYDGSVSHTFDELSLKKAGLVYARCNAIKKDVDILRDAIRTKCPVLWSGMPNSDKGHHRDPASKMARIMQHIERHLMLVTARVAKEAGFEIGDYCHDGLFLSKRHGDREKVELFFKEAEMAIRNETSFIVKFSIKDMSYEQPWTSNWSPSYVPLSDGLTDHYLIGKFKTLMDGRIRYCCKTFWIYDSGECLWRESHAGEIVFKEFVPRMTDYIKALPCDEGTKTELLGHIASGSGMITVGRNLKGAFDERGFMELLDKCKGEVPIKDGKMLDLRSLQTRDRKLEDYCTSFIDRRLTESTGSIDKFFHDILEKGDKIEFIQKSLGYTLSGEKNIDMFCVFIGSGANGKTILFNLISDTFPTFSTSIDEDRLSTNGNTNLTAGSCYGKRFVYCSETSDDLVIKESLIKKLSSSDDLDVKKLYKDMFTAVNQVIPYIGTNYMPALSMSKAVLRRARYLKFPFTFTTDESLLGKGDEYKLADPRVSDSLDLDEFFTWVCRGASEYYKHGITPSKEILDETKEYLADADDLTQFLDLYEPSLDEFMKRSDLASRASGFCKRKVSSQKITKACEEKGWKVCQRKGTGRGFKLVLIADDDDSDDGGPSDCELVEKADDSRGDGAK